MSALWPFEIPTMGGRTIEMSAGFGHVPSISGLCLVGVLSS